MKHQELQNQTVEIKIEQQIIEKQDDVMIDRPQISEKEQALEKNIIHTKMMKEKR
jgi:hypothetical protein